MESTMKEQDDYRFGFTENDINSEIKEHAGIFRAGCYIPTRLEVMSMPVDDLYFILDGWMWESPSSLIPTRDQIAEVKNVVKERPDQFECKKLIKSCDAYICSRKI
jgi:hypothetical protein